ncbi:hypothetical protein WDA79_09845 [Streptomyces sp. A475]|uniref:hypothetical protein n=1 Tax=Streptomyces sp. A475 TaxID=3131976 RepID=UPI0030C91C26
MSDALKLLTGFAVNWDEEREIIDGADGAAGADGADGADIAARRAEPAESSSDKLRLSPVQSP